MRIVSLLASATEIVCALGAGRLAFADGNLFFNRSGMTVSRTAEIIAEILHGVEFAGTRQGEWVWAETGARSGISELAAQA